MSGVWEPRRVELDTPPRDPDLPATSYVICSTPRSGSGLLCRGLASSGLAGAPAEYFNPNQRVPLAARWNAESGLDAYVAALRARRSSAAGVFGTKLHADQLGQLRAEAHRTRPDEPVLSLAFLERLLPNLRYVRIVRRDVDRQAISLWTAMQSGVWSVRKGTRCAAAPVDVPYDFAGIERYRRVIVYGDAHWDRVLRFNAIAPVEVVYEELVASFAATVRPVLETILGTAVDPGSIAPPDSVKQGDARSEELYARYGAERAASGVGPALARPATA